MNREVIQEICDFDSGDQCWKYEYIINEDGHKLQVLIHLKYQDVFDPLSYARVERWDGSKWQYVCHKPISECICKMISYTDIDASIHEYKLYLDRFHLDRETLIVMAFKILR